MGAYLALLSCVLGYTFASFFNKLFATRYKGDSSVATPVFTALFGLIVSFGALSIGCGFRPAPSWQTLVFGLCDAVILFLYNRSAIGAAQTGPYALQSIFASTGSVLIPSLFSVIYWGDSLSPVQIVGIVMMVAAFIVINGRGLIVKGLNRKFVLWIAILFVTNGAFGAVLDSQGRVMMAAERSEMIAVTYLGAALISVVYLLATKRGEAVKAFRMDGLTALYVLLTGIATTAAVYLIMEALAGISTAIVYTIANGGVLVLCILLSVFVLKEKMSKNVIIGIILSVISMALMSV